MSEFVTSARTARESLARGLNALQGFPNLPPQLLEAAAPIAQAMGALMQIERSGQLQPNADTALQLVRGALSTLQSQGVEHPAVNQALEAVAGSLALVHSLSRANAAAQAAPAQAAPRAPQPAGQPSFPTAGQPAFPTAPTGGQQAYVQPMAPMVTGAPVAAQPPPPPVPKPAAPQAAVQAAPTFAQPPNMPTAQPGQALFQSQVFPPGSPGADGPVIEVPLGAHSANNFYKGLSGNDIVDHGGLFISTYKILKIGTNIRVRVSLPGGYEFEALATVRWTREATETSSHDAPPGYGVQFTQITGEAKQLVYRYVRNREPLFHDDL